MLRFFASNKRGSFQLDHHGGPIEFGREPREGFARRVLDDPYVSANQLRVEELPGQLIRIENLSKRVPIQLADGTTIEAGKFRIVALSTRLTVGNSLIEILPGGPDELDTQALKSIAQPFSSRATGLLLQPRELGDAPTVEQLTRWFETVVSVQRAAACSAEFYREIAKGVVDLIGLDYGLVLLHQGGEWQTVARYAAEDAAHVEPSLTLLEHARRERLTFYQAEGLADAAKSLAGVRAVVVSPVFDADRAEVIGAVYGAKMQRGAAETAQIRPLYAQLVQVLAGAATSGIARARSDAEAARQRVQFEQFFSRELAAELDNNPEMLTGHDCEVTILVSDVRGFSRIAERLGPRATCTMMGDILECLTARIHEEGGVVVDYVGDGILAMWNAPLPQRDHAARACRAALAMQGELTGLNERWSGAIGGPLALGIGVNTGMALVGNTGSKQRLKYGALGNTVNLASRVEGATKHLGVPILLTGATHSQLAGAFATRRLCRVRAVGIDTPVVLYELHGQTAHEDWRAERDAYESALDHYEQGRLSEACRALFPLLDGRAGRFDKSALALVSRSVEALRSGTTPFDPVINLDSK